MKNVVLFAAWSACACWVQAQEVGRVISSTPVTSQFAVPHQVCHTEQVSVPGAKSGGGALLGAIAGGAMGNAVGRGDTRAVATMIGVMGGAIVGDRIEGGSAPQVHNVQRCGTQTTYENRVTAYHVVYEYAGRHYTVQMPSDPGPTIRLQVTPLGVPPAPTAPVAMAPPSQPAYLVPTYIQTTVIERPAYIHAPVPVFYPVYRGYPRAVPAAITVNLGHPGGHQHGNGHGHGHGYRRWH